MGTRASVSVHDWHGVAAVTLAAGELAATFLPDVGMLGVSLHHRGAELLALPGGLDAYRHDHVTGLPLLAPWANRLGAWGYRVGKLHVDLNGLPLPTDPNGLPIHGTMTAQTGWEIVSLAASDDTATLRTCFHFGERDDLLESFPFPHDLAMEHRVDEGSLRVTTTLRPTSRRKVPVSFGFHPYLHLPGPPRHEWRLRLPAREQLMLDERSLPTGETRKLPAENDPIFMRTFDDLFALGRDRQFELVGGGRRLTLTFDRAYPYLQVFVPPGKPFACIEPMTAPIDALRSGDYELVGPDEEYRARFTIAVDLHSGSALA
jgi:aldose 1-epimerase